MFPPDSAWDPASQYRESLAAIQAGDAIGEDDAPGMHVTDTLDIVTILSGELYVVLEDCETLLRPGDTVVQRGTKHTWSNRSEEPCVLVIGITHWCVRGNAQPSLLARLMGGRLPNVA